MLRGLCLPHQSVFQTWKVTSPYTEISHALMTVNLFTTQTNLGHEHIPVHCGVTGGEVTLGDEDHPHPSKKSPTKSISKLQCFNICLHQMPEPFPDHP